MSVSTYEGLKPHRGHHIVCVGYGDPEDPVNIAIECEDCYEVIVDYEKVLGFTPFKIHWYGTDRSENLVNGTFEVRLPGEWNEIDPDDLEHLIGKFGTDKISDDKKLLELNADIEDWEPLSEGAYQLWLAAGYPKLMGKDKNFTYGKY